MRLRQIRKRGNGFVIPLTKSDIKDLELRDGQEVDIEDIVPQPITLHPRVLKMQNKGIVQEGSKKK